MRLEVVKNNKHNKDLSGAILSHLSIIIKNCSNNPPLQLNVSIN